MARSSVDEALREFLSQTKDLDLSPAERLRKLAIRVEDEVLISGGWRKLSEIYRAASLLEPRNVDVYHSWGISAAELIGSYEGDLADLEHIHAEGSAALSRALELCNDDPALLYSLGSLNYNRPHEGEDEEHVVVALGFFRQCLARSPEDPMAGLYLGHCHADLEEWQEAKNVYASIDQKALRACHASGPWRVLKLKEQIAWCCAKLGEEEAAAGMLSGLFDELEGMSDDEVNDELCCLDEAHAALTRMIDRPDLRVRLFRQLRRIGLERMCRKDGEGGYCCKRL